MKYVFVSIILLISLLVINNLLRSIVNLTQKQELISNAQKQLEKEKKENHALKQQLLYVNKQQFVEEQARNKLFMVKGGEQIIIVPKELTQTKSTSESGTKEQLLPIQEWVKLFL